jgi:hypothetical protein
MAVEDGERVGRIFSVVLNDSLTRAESCMLLPTSAQMGELPWTGYKANHSRARSRSSIRSASAHPDINHCRSKGNLAPDPLLHPEGVLRAIEDE